MTQDWKKLYEREPEYAQDQNAGYSATALDHFTNPRNVGHVSDYHGMGKFGDPHCGDFLEISLCINDEDIITKIGYLVYGCAGAVATTSVVSEIAKGTDIRSALKITKQDVVDALGGFPEEKVHCSLMGIEALRLALADALFGRQLIEQGKVPDYERYRALRLSGKIRFEYQQGEPQEQSE